MPEETPGPTPADPAAVGRKEFLAVRAETVKARESVSLRLEQTILAGATGALVLSITFIKDIAPHPTPDSLLYLTISWITLALSLGASVAGQFINERAYMLLRAILDDEYSGGGRGDDLEAMLKTWNAWHLTSKVVGIGLVLGVAFLAYFAFVNLPGPPIGPVPFLR